jgi:hypothetical protein
VRKKSQEMEGNQKLCNTGRKERVQGSREGDSEQD